MALTKLQKYCAYQDRCHSEVRSKLLELGIYGDDLEEVIFELIQDNFLNEERFARSYARGKFRMKQWGRNKILRELKKRDISEYCIRKGMEEIDEAEYERTFKELLAKTWERKKGKNHFDKKGKVARYLIQRGFEPGMVWEELKKY